jgi:hypothetical protein
MGIPSARPDAAPTDRERHGHAAYVGSRTDGLPGRCFLVRSAPSPAEASCGSNVEERELEMEGGQHAFSSNAAIGGQERTQHATLSAEDSSFVQRA